TANTVGVIYVPDVARFECYAGCTPDTGVFVSSECCLEIAIRGRNAISQAKPILDRHAGALRQRLESRMRGVAQKHNATLMPMSDWITVADRLAPTEIKHRQQRLHRGVRVAVSVLKLGPVGRHIAALRARRSSKYGDDIK